MIATGGQYGTIILWDFELFKVIGVLIGSKMAITAIEFVETYPLLVSVGQCGIISVYAIRGAPNAIRCMCLARFLNIGMEFSSHKNIPITSAFIEVRKNLEYNPLTRRMSELAQTLSFFKTALPEGEQDMNKFSKNMFDHNIDRSVEFYKTSFNTSEVMKEVVDGEVQSPKNPKYVDPEEGIFLNSDNEHLFPRYYPSFGNSENPFYLNLVLSDVQGNVKWLDLSAFIRRPTVEEVSINKNEAEQARLLRDQKARAPYVDVTKPHHEVKIGFMPSRRIEAEAGSVALSLQDIARKQVLPTILDAKRCVQVK